MKVSGQTSDPNQTFGQPAHEIGRTRPATCSNWCYSRFMKLPIVAQASVPLKAAAAETGVSNEGAGWKHRGTESPFWGFENLETATSPTLAAKRGSKNPLSFSFSFSFNFEHSRGVG